MEQEQVFEKMAEAVERYLKLYGHPHMTIIADLAGIEVVEGIKAKSFTTNDYKLIMNNNIIKGSEIVKLPWEPKKHDFFYYPFVVEERVASSFWEDYNTFHLALKVLGMIYRTKEEAEANLAKDYEELTGKPLSGANFFSDSVH